MNKQEIDIEIDAIKRRSRLRRQRRNDLISQIRKRGRTPWAAAEAEQIRLDLGEDIEYLSSLYRMLNDCRH